MVLYNTQETSDTLGKNLIKKMSIKEFSEACGVTSTTISNYESEKRKPDMDMIDKLAKVLDTFYISV